MPSPTRSLKGLLLLLAGLAPPVAGADIYVASANPRTDQTGGLLYYRQDGTGCSEAVGSVPLASSLTGGVAVSLDGSRVYVANFQDGTVSIVDARTRSVTANVPTGGNAIDVAATATRAYVTSSTQISIVDPALGAVLSSVRVPGTPVRLALNPAGTRLYAVLSGQSQLAVLETAGNSLLAPVPLDAAAQDVATSVDGSRLYVVLPTTLLVLDATNYSVIARVPLPEAPASAPAGSSSFARGVAVHPDGTRVYVAMSVGAAGVNSPGLLAVVSTGSNSVLYTRDLGLGPFNVAVDSTRVAVANSLEQVFDNTGPIPLTQSTISYFDARTDAPLPIERVGRSAFGVAAWTPPAPPPLPTGIEITGFEVTQAIQDLANSVPLVAGRRTFVRVHAKSTGGASVDSTATLFVIRARGAGNLGVFETPLGSLEVINPGGRIWVRPAPRREVVDDSYLYELPRTWDILENDRLKFYVVPRTVGTPPPTECRGDVPRKEVSFGVGTRLKMQFVRLAYDLNGTRYQATPAEQLASEAWIRATYPLTTLISPNAALPVVYVPGLGSRVQRTAAECGADGAAPDMCATDFVVPFLALYDMVTGALGGGDGAYALIPRAPGASTFTRGACCTANIGAGPANVVDYAAHEIGHLLQRDHPVEGAGDLLCGHDPVDAAFPYSQSLIRPASQLNDPTGFAGFDSRGPNFAVYSTNTFRYDFMGYCKPSWVSDYTYRGLYSRLNFLRLLEFQSAKQNIRSSPRTPRARAQAVQTGDWLVLSGTVYSGATAAARFRALRVAEVARVPERVAGDYSIRLLGAGGTVLADYPFTPSEVEDAATGTARAFAFTQVVGFVSGTTQVQVVDLRGSTRVIASKAVSAAAPVVSNVAPQGTPDPATGRLTVSWSASDADGDALAYDVLVSRNGGTFVPLALGVTETTAVLDTSRLGGGPTRVRVVASDGLLSGTAESASFTLADAAPEVSILWPVVPTRLVSGQPLALEGEAADPQDGTVAASGLVWSAGSRTLGTGANLTVSDLPVGDHTVTLTATNSVGRSASASVRVTVEAVAADPGPRLAAGPVQLGWHVAAGATDTVSATITVINSGTGTLQFNAQSSATWLTLDSNTGAAPTTIALTGRPAGLQSGRTYTATVTLAAIGFPDQTLAIPVTLSIGNAFNVDPAPPPAAPPVANAGADLAANEGGTVTLSAAQSTGTIARYEWRQLSGTAVTLQSATTATATFTAPRPSGSSEQLRFQLQVFDADGQNTTDEVVVTVTATPTSGGDPPAPQRRRGGGSLDLVALLALLGLALRRAVGPHSRWHGHSSNTRSCAWR